MASGKQQESQNLGRWCGGSNVIKPVAQPRLIPHIFCFSFSAHKRINHKRNAKVCFWIGHALPFRQGLERGLALPDSWQNTEAMGCVLPLACNSCLPASRLEIEYDLMWFDLRGGDESHKLVGTETGEWRAWQGLPVGGWLRIVWEAEEPAWWGVWVRPWGVFGEKERMCKKERGKEVL